MNIAGSLKHYDVLIIGGGHNGLVCACYLAGAGLKVRVLERRHVVGGAAVTEEFHPGFRNSTASYTVSLLNPKVIRDLKLRERGLVIVERPYANFLPLPGGGHFRLGPTLEATQAELARFSKRDAARLPDYYRMIGRAAQLLKATLLQTPPNAGGGWRDWLAAIGMGRRLKNLDMAARRDLLELFTRSAGEMLDDWFESDPIKAAFGFDAVVGHFASPYSAGSAYVLLHHAIGEVNGKPGIWGHAMGGMGAITQAMAKEALARGVEISTNAAVAEVRVDNGRALGVLLDDGEQINADRLAANVNPKLLYTKLVAPQHLDCDFRGRIERYKCASGTLRINVALSELPDFSCAPGNQAQAHHSSGIIIAPSLAYMEQAFADARALDANDGESVGRTAGANQAENVRANGGMNGGANHVDNVGKTATGWSRAPIVEMLIPSTVDDSLAPAGRHVASLFCQQFSPALPRGRSWDDARDAAADLAIDTVNGYAPNFRASVIARKILTPLDLEREFGLTGGDIFHGRLSLDQLFSARPLLGHADYRGPIAGLYLCGAGAHPGGGVSGIPGHNAAREILRDCGRCMP